MGRERHSPLYDPTAAICAFETSVPSAAKVGNPPFVLHMPRHAAPSTNVVEGLRAAVRRVCHERQVRAVRYIYGRVKCPNFCPCIYRIEGR